MATRSSKTNREVPDALTGGAGLDLAMAALSGASGGTAGAVVAQVTSRVQNRAPRHEAPKVELPPGVRRK